MTNITSSLTLQLVDDVTKPARTVAQALKDTQKNIAGITKAMAGTGASTRFMSQLGKMNLSGKNIDSVSQALKDYAKSNNLAAKASKWTTEQKAAFRTFETSVVSSLRAVEKEQERFARSNARAAANARKQAAAQRKAIEVAQALPPPQPPAENGGHGRPGVVSGRHVGGIAAYVGAHALAHRAHTAVERAREADSSLRYQQAIADLTDDERKSRTNQAIRLAGTSGLKVADIAKGQEKLAARGVKKEFIEPFVEQLVSYSRAMKAPLEDAAKTLETIIFSTNQHVEDAKTAKTVMQRQIDMAVKASKMGGMNDDDISMAAKFAGSSAHGAGFSNEWIWAMAAALSRGGLHGDQSGTAIRSISSKLVSPTAKGMDALNAMGIDYNKFSTMPGGMSPDNLNPMMKRRFGKGLTGGQMGQLRDIMSDEDVVGNRDDFVEKVSAVIQQSFARTKQGKVKAQDAQKIAKLAGDFYKMAIESVDVQGLLMAILEKHPAMQQLNALFTSQQGGKVNVMATQLDTLKGVLGALEHLPPGFANSIADTRTAGLSGSLDKLDGATDALTTKIGLANEGLVAFAANLATAVANKAAQAPDGAVQVGTGAAAVGAGYLSIKALQAFSEGGLKGVFSSAGGGLAEMGGGALKMLSRLPALAPLLGFAQLVQNAADQGQMKGAVVPSDQSMGPAAPGGKFDPGGMRLQLPLPTPENLESTKEANKQLGDMKTNAEGAKTALADISGATVAPKVNNADLQTMLNLVNAISAGLDKIGVSFSKTKAASQNIPSVGAAQRGRFTTGGVVGSAD